MAGGVRLRIWEQMEWAGVGKKERTASTTSTSSAAHVLAALRCSKFRTGVPPISGTLIRPKSKVMNGIVTGADEVWGMWKMGGAGVVKDCVAYHLLLLSKCTSSTSTYIGSLSPSGASETALPSASHNGISRANRRSLGGLEFGRECPDCGWIRAEGNTTWRPHGRRALSQWGAEAHDLPRVGFLRAEKGDRQ